MPTTKVAIDEPDASMTREFECAVREVGRDENRISA